MTHFCRDCFAPLIVRFTEVDDLFYISWHCATCPEVNQNGRDVPVKVEGI